MKKCNKCGEEKEITEFFKDKGFKDGHASICKKCKEAKTYEWRAKNKDKYNADMRKYNAAHKRARRDCDYKRKYGITLEAYEAMLAAQGGVCWICKKSKQYKNHLCLDHNHKTGDARGILCYGCNRALHTLENENLLPQAMAYLEHFKRK